MSEPTCLQRFDFEYERVFGTGTIPKEDLQKIMFGDMRHFSPTRDTTADDVLNGIDSLSFADDRKEAPEHCPQDASNRHRK